MSRTPTTVLEDAGLSEYDRGMPGNLQEAYYGGSGFYNFGYWTPETKSQAEASAMLVSQLLDFIPEKTGTILDVACGMGATTAMLRRHYSPQSIYAVNISPAQLALGLKRAPECAFIAMDAVDLAFKDESFDNIICVEAAFHFATRTDFLREAFRLLKPGGRLVHSDILARRKAPSRQVNHLADPAALKRNLESVGFTEVEVLDRTETCMGGFYRNIKAWPGQERRAGRIGWKEYLHLSMLSRLFTASLQRRIDYYLLSRARKPLA